MVSIGIFYYSLSWGRVFRNYIVKYNVSRTFFLDAFNRLRNFPSIPSWLIFFFFFTENSVVFYIYWHVHMDFFPVFLFFLIESLLVSLEFFLLALHDSVRVPDTLTFLRDTPWERGKQSGNIITNPM